MKRFFRILKRIWIFSFIRRICYASKYYNKKYSQIIKWGFASKEYTTYTYHLTEDNLLNLAQTISVVTHQDCPVILEYFRELESNRELKDHIIQTIKGSDEKKYADLEVRFGRRLGWYAFARIIKPKVIIETGVDKGLGSVVLCAALEKNAEEDYEDKYY